MTTAARRAPAQLTSSMADSARSRDFAALDRQLDSLRTAHAQTPPSGVLEDLVEILAADATDSRVIVAARALAAMPSPGSRELAALLVRAVKPRSATTCSRVVKIVASLSDDGNWEVREYAAGAFGELLKSPSRQILGQVLKAARVGSSRIHRAIAVGVKYAAKERVERHAASYLRLLRPLMSDRDPYVRKNMGPFAIGDGLLRYFPSATIVWLKACARGEDEVVRWNVAMSFAAAEGSKHVPEAMGMLGDLADDPRVFVQRAVVAALRRLMKRDPRRVTELLKLWLAGGTRSVVAAQVLPRGR